MPRHIGQPAAALEDAVALRRFCLTGTLRRPRAYAIACGQNTNDDG